MTIAVKPMTPAHLDSVWEVERRSFAMPLSRAGFERELTLSMARLRVAQRQGEVVGYLNYWLVDGEVHIMTIAVLPGERRKGVGKALFENLLAETQGCEIYHLEMRASNHGARAFYEQYGFQVCGKRSRYYADNQEDALLMIYHRDEQNLPQKRVIKNTKLSAAN